MARQLAERVAGIRGCASIRAGADQHRHLRGDGARVDGSRRRGTLEGIRRALLVADERHLRAVTHYEVTPAQVDEAADRLAAIVAGA